MEPARLQQALQLMGEINAEAGVNAETKRITDNIDMFELMIRQACSGVTVVVGGHHIMFLIEGRPLPMEIPSADALIFDHVIARHVWGERYPDALSQLALEPTATRDALLRKLYYRRST